MSASTIGKLVLDAISPTGLLDPPQHNYGLRPLTPEESEIEEHRFWNTQLASETSVDRATREQVLRQFVNCVFAGAVPHDSVLRHLAEGMHGFLMRPTDSETPLEEYLLPPTPKARAAKHKRANEHERAKQYKGRPADRVTLVRKIIACYYIAQGDQTRPRMFHNESKERLAKNLGGSPSTYQQYWDRPVIPGTELKGRDLGKALVKGDGFDGTEVHAKVLVESRGMDFSLSRLLNALSDLRRSGKSLSLDALPRHELRTGRRA